MRPLPFQLVLQKLNKIWRKPFSLSFKLASQIVKIPMTSGILAVTLLLWYAFQWIEKQILALIISSEWFFWQPLACCSPYDVSSNRSQFTIANSSVIDEKCGYPDCAATYYVDFARSENSLTDPLTGCSSGILVWKISSENLGVLFVLLTIFMKNPVSELASVVEYALDDTVRLCLERVGLGRMTVYFCTFEWSFDDLLWFLFLFYVLILELLVDLTLIVLLCRPLVTWEIRSAAFLIFQWWKAIIWIATLKLCLPLSR